MENILNALKEILNKLVDGLIVSGIGIGTTFSIMLLLILSIYLVKIIISGINNINKEPVKVSKKITKPDNNVVIEENIDPKIVAAITAAVTCYIKEEGRIAGPKAGFIVRNIRRI